MCEFFFSACINFIPFSIFFFFFFFRLTLENIASIPDDSIKIWDYVIVFEGLSFPVQRRSILDFLLFFCQFLPFFLFHVQIIAYPQEFFNDRKEQSHEFGIVFSLRKKKGLVLNYCSGVQHFGCALLYNNPRFLKVGFLFFFFWASLHLMFTLFLSEYFLLR